LRWDSVDIREINKEIESIKKPIFLVHAIARGGSRSAGERVKFAVALTVELVKTEVQIYPKIRAKYAALLPIRLDISVNVTVPPNGRARA
jgi:hypothetical protein